jgi:dipeptidyl aminopeptidase/acylaminoacyl peptidase
MRFLLRFTLPIGPYASPIALSLLSLAEPSPSLSDMSLIHPALIAAASALPFASTAAAAAPDTSFLDFPQVETVSAAKVPAFAWIVRQSDRTSLLFARGPHFRRVTLASRTDEDGQPITDTLLSPDGAHVAFTTGVPLGENGFNPASLVESPTPTLWLVRTSAGAPRKLGVGLEPSFSPDGRLLLFKRAGDLWSVDTHAVTAKPRLFAKGGGDWSQLVWTKAGDLIFVADRRGYSFLGRFRPGGAKIDWLATGVDRLAVPVLSPDESAVAYLRLPGRKHSVTYDQTEAEPFAIDLLDLASGTARTLWTTRDKALTLGMDDPEGALRWTGNDRLVFYSEEDGWGRLYALSRSGGAPKPLTPTGCDVAESEAAGDRLLVIDNCPDLDTRHLSLIDPATGAEHRVAEPDPVLAKAASSGAYAAFVGANVNQAPLLRIVDAKTGQTRMAERYSDYAYTNPLIGPAPREVHLTSPDGNAFTGQLFLPPTPGAHPGLIYVHGGPQRQMFLAFHYIDYYANDYAINRRLAEQGFAVLAVNYRSGIGYGRAFRDARGRAWRSASEYQDVVGAGRWLAAQPGVDPNRIGIWGGSYGGLLTGQALARNSDLFKAGVGIHGVYDWSWPSPIKGHLSPSHYFGVDEADKDQAKAASPIGAIKGWRSPVLLVSGDQDMNVDVVETVDLAQQLREQGVDVRTLILPGEAHDFIRHSAWKRVYAALDSFLTEKLK